MSSLNLVPDPHLMLAQAGLFLANIYVINKKIVQPFVQLKEKRFQLTEGAQKEAQKAREKSSELLALIEERTKRAHQEVQKAAQKRKEQVEAVQSQESEKVRQESAERLKEAKDKMLAGLREERKKIPESAELLAQQFVKTLR